MSFSLKQGTKPEGLRIINQGSEVQIGDYRLSMNDFLAAAFYVLTSTNLSKGDPRLQFVECVKSMMVMDGFPEEFDQKEITTFRLATNITPIPRSPLVF